jgi:PAS domain S-box-containing protein
VDNGHIQRIEDGKSTDDIVVSVGDDPTLLPEGATLDRATTYCRRTVESHSPIALSSAPEQGWDDDPAYLEHGFDCYLGTTIFVRGDIYGTVCFISRDARETDFTADEQAFVELLARLLGRELESRQLEQTEQARQQTADKYETLVRLAPDAVFLADAETAAITEVNKKAVELTGYEESKLTEMSVLELHPKEDREHYADLFDGIPAGTPRSAFDDGTPLSLRRADGTDLPIEMSVSPVTIDGRDHMFGLVRDISARRQRERELRVKNQAIEEAPVGITIGDATEPDIPIMYANEGFTTLTGYPKDSVLGENCRFLQGEDTEEATVAEIRDAIESESPIRTEILNYRADGTPFWNRLTVAPVTGNETDEVTHFVGIQQDITEEKRRERLIEVLNRVLRHNIGNDMNVVTGFANAIAEETDGETAEMAVRIRQAADRLIDLSAKARSFQTAVQDGDTPGRRNVVEDIETVVADLRADFPTVEFDIDVRDNTEVVATESLRLALTELGENAAKHAESSPVTYRVDTESDGDVVIEVSDRGPGLPEAEQQVLQDGRETPMKHGSGLGLWLVNWIVTGLGGDVTTTVSDGTTVTVRLPSQTGGAVSGYRNGTLGTVQE